MKQTMKYSLKIKKHKKEAEIERAEDREQDFYMEIKDDKEAKNGGATNDKNAFKGKTI